MNPFADIFQLFKQDLSNTLLTEHIPVAAFVLHDTFKAKLIPSFNLVLVLEDYSEINHNGFRKTKGRIEIELQSNV